MPEPQRVKFKDGREGFVAYLDADFNPVEFEKAEMMKILFDDGDTLWAAPKRIGEMSAK